jgi:hypothetical protein
MSVGFTLNKVDLDNKAGSLAMSLRDDLARCAAFCDLLNDTSVFADDAALVALGYTQGEVTTLRAAFTDLKKLWSISHAAATQSPANDFFFNAKHLVGVN